MTLRLPAAVLLLLAACFLSSCAQQQLNVSGGEPTIRVGTRLAAEQVLNRHLEGDPRTLDPSLAEDLVGYIVLNDLCEGLVAVDEAGAVVPGVATTWETSADGLTWTFHLRPNAKWSNGAPLTAGDFVYSWRRQVDPKTASEDAQSLEPIVNAIDIATGKKPPEELGVDAPNSQTLVVHLHQPTTYLLSLLTNNYLWPVYEPAIKRWGDNWTAPGHFVCNGAYQLTERVLNGHITLIKNPYFWDASKVRLSKVTYYVVSDYGAAEYQYLSGSLDWTNRINPSDKPLLERTIGDQLFLSPEFATGGYDYNFDKPPFKDNPKLRLAMNMAIDRDIISKYIERGVTIPAYSLTPALPGYDPVVPDWAKLPDDQRHALARKLYHEAGYSDSHPAEAVLTYQSGGADLRRFNEALSAMWQQNLGAHIQIYNVEWKVLLEERQLMQLTLFWAAWQGEYFDPYSFLQMYLRGNAQNNGDYYNPQYEALMDEASRTIDTAKRYELFRQAEEILNQDAPFLPIYFYQSIHLIKPYVKGWKPNARDQHLSRYMYVLEHQGD